MEKCHGVRKSDKSPGRASEDNLRPKVPAGQGGGSQAVRKAAAPMSAEGAEKFRLLFDNSPDAIVLIDGETYIDCNEAALAMIGCESGKTS